MKLAILLCIVYFAHAFSNCGKPLHNEESDGAGRHKRIIGGNAAPKGKWPWQIYMAIETKDGNFSTCGGTVISESWILTAAHCVEELDAGYTVLLGLSHINDTTASDELVIISNVEQIVPHPQYVIAKTPMPEDIALLKLKTALTFNHRVSPVCLPNRAQPIPTDGQAVATGFGTTNDRGTNHTYSDGQLKEVILPIVNAETCKTLVDKEAEDGDDTEDDGTPGFEAYPIICAGSIGHQIGEGDSGGPLIMKSSDERWFQIGVTSFGEDDGKAAAGSSKPGAFTDVRKYCDWIKETTKGDAECQEEIVTLQDLEIPL